jgi:hypothetical protein
LSWVYWRRACGMLTVTCNVTHSKFRYLRVLKFQLRSKC